MRQNYESASELGDRVMRLKYETANRAAAADRNTPAPPAVGVKLGDQPSKERTYVTNSIHWPDRYERARTL